MRGEPADKAAKPLRTGARSLTLRGDRTAAGTPEVVVVSVAPDSKKSGRLDRGTSPNRGFLLIFSLTHGVLLTQAWVSRPWHDSDRCLLSRSIAVFLLAVARDASSLSTRPLARDASSLLTRPLTNMQRGQGSARRPSGAHLEMA